MISESDDYHEGDLQLVGGCASSSSELRLYPGLGVEKSEFPKQGPRTWYFKNSYPELNQQKSVLKVEPCATPPVTLSGAICLQSRIVSVGKAFSFRPDDDPSARPHMLPIR
jgi:hypothetical protein